MKGCPVVRFAGLGFLCMQSIFPEYGLLSKQRHWRESSRVRRHDMVVHKDSFSPLGGAML